MENKYYKPCKEFDRCNELIDKYWESKQYDKCFAGHMELAERGYPLAECQIGYFYMEGLGCKKDLDKALYWTQKAAEHGDWDAQYNLGSFYEEGISVEKNLEKAKDWLKQPQSRGMIWQSRSALCMKSSCKNKLVNH